MPKKSAIEILVFKPNPSIPSTQRGVHENLWVKQRAEAYCAIGVYLADAGLQYYFFKDCDHSPKIYSSLLSLKGALPEGFEAPKILMMGHGHGGLYGLGNSHGASEAIYNNKTHPHFDTLIKDIENAFATPTHALSITLEACNTDNALQAKEKKEKTSFLERLSAAHPHITFCGSAPWDPQDKETGSRASGGFPTLHTPITAMVGGIWKPGNSVIFHHNAHQVAVKKSLFASTETAKALKINTLNYASQFTAPTTLTEIAINRDILTITDLEKTKNLLNTKNQGKSSTFIENEKMIIAEENSRYIAHIEAILTCAAPNTKITARDVLMIALGLKNMAVFKGHEALRDKILENNALLSLVMVSCGKVLIGGPSNDALIDLLLTKNIDINSVDEKGMTALHYAAQNFYHYRQEPLALIRKLIACGANRDAENLSKQTPLMLATEHSKKTIVVAGDALLTALQKPITKETYTPTLFKTKHSTQQCAAVECSATQMLTDHHPH